MTKHRLEPFFLATDNGRLFALLRAPAGASRCVLFVPPFAEEMNKSRWQFTKMSQALIEKGFATLVIDLFGTGDSEGEFADASWSIWKDNIRSAIRWAAESDLPVDTLIATRLGCALAADSMSDAYDAVRKTVFWQPVILGRQFMTQFLRLRVAASMMENDNAESVDGLRDRLRGGETLEVAGYDLGPGLWSDIESSNLLELLSDKLGQVLVAEVGRKRDSGLSPAGVKVTNALRGSALQVQGCRIEGEPFWTATEIVVNLPLRQATLEFIDSGN